MYLGILNKLRSATQALSMHSPGPLGQSILNIISFVFQYPSTYRIHEGIVEVFDRSTGITMRSQSLRQAAIYYDRGFLRRSEQLHRDYLIENIHFDDGDIIVDCGANNGDLGLYFYLHGLDVQYIAFEPSPSEYLCLKQNSLLSSSSLYNEGLWSRDTSLPFYISTEFADSSFIRPRAHTEIKEITAARGDQHPALIGKHIKLFKIEAEGAEPEVIEGLSGILSNIEYISVDVDFERGIQEDSTLPSVVNSLLSSDFTLLEVGRPRLVLLFHNRKYTLSNKHKPMMEC